MAAAATDKLKKLSRRWVGQIGAGGVADDSATTVPLSSATNLATDTAVVVVIDRVDANGTATPSLEETIIGVVSGSNLVNCVRGVEGTAQAHSAGAVVEVLVTAKGWNDLVDHLLVEHNQDGTHGAITGDSITASNVTAANVTASGTISSSRINPRETTEASSATPTINTDNTDIHTITALEDDITSFTTNLSGTPVDGQKLIIRIQDSGSGQTIAWGASFENAGGTLPTSITAGKKAYVGLMYNADDSIWDCVAAGEEA